MEGNRPNPDSYKTIEQLRELITQTSNQLNKIQDTLAMDRESLEVADPEKKGAILSRIELYEAELERNRKAQEQNLALYDALCIKEHGELPN